MSNEKILYEIIVRIKGQEEGTGFYINKNTILTAYHVVKFEQQSNQDVIIIKKPDDKLEIRGKVLAYDEELDIAVIKTYSIDSMAYLPIISRNIKSNEEWKTYTCFDPYDDSHNLFEKELIKGKIFQVESFRNRIFDIHLGNDYLSNSIHIGNLQGCSGTPLIINNEIVGIIIKEEKSQRDTGLKAVSFKKYVDFFIKNNIDYKYNKEQDMLIELDIKEVDIEYIKLSTNISFQNLGVRYNREFNVDVELTELLQKFLLTGSSIEDIKNIFDKIGCEIRNLSDTNENNLLAKVNYLKNNISDIDNLDCTLLKSELDKFQEEVYKFINEKYGSHTNEYYNSKEKGYYNNLQRYNTELEVYREVLKSSTLIVTGQAGIGKSHSVTHFCNEFFAKNNKICILILGQNLNSTEDPIKMIESYLNIPNTLQSFLDELNMIGKYSKTIIPFVIDAINEGMYSEVWKNSFLGIVHLFEKYKWIKLVISIRSTYINKCLPKDYNKINSVMTIEHRGFENNSIEAVRQFFEYYEVPIPTFPILYSKYYNPLFLQTLCKTLKKIGNYKITEYSSFSKVFEDYINAVELEVAEKIGYFSSLKIIRKITDEISKFSLEHNRIYGIEMSEFYTIVISIAKQFDINSNKLIQLLFEEGLFYREIHRGDDKEYVQFAYERYHNILAAQYILREINSKEDIVISIRQGILKEFIERPYDGITEELFILIPDRYSIELISVLTELQAKDNIENYLNSLFWRNKSNICVESTKEIINEFVMPYEYYYKIFIEQLLILSPIEQHPLNILFLQMHLKKMTMSQRDGLISEILYNGYSINSTLNNLVSFCYSKGINECSMESKKLIVYMLSWSLLTSNIKYRNVAIKAMVNLLQNNISLMNSLIDNFKDINDSYIKEGIYCSIYGAILRNHIYNEKEVQNLIKIIYDDIFNHDEVYPNILVRDYAREVIEYFKYLGIDIKIDVQSVRPPYKSKWYKSIPTEDEIKSFYVDYEKCSDTRMYAANEIISSMATNTGKSHMMYGDFGRYVFEGWVDLWSHEFTKQDLSNIATRTIFTTMEYDANIHGGFDRLVKSYNRHSNKCERIGKKYQRIASYELLARLSDNFKSGKLEYVYDDYKNRKKVLNEIQYEGPWQIGIRQIDPSILNHNYKKVEKNYIEHVLKTSNIDNEEWASKDSIEPSEEDILFFEKDNEEYVILEMYNTWKLNEITSNKENKQYYVKAIALLVDKEELNEMMYDEDIKEYARNSHNFETYQVYAREYPWGQSYKYLKNKYELELECGVDKYIETGVEYNSSDEYDENQIQRFTMPSEYIIQKLNLKQIDDGKWYDENNNLIAYDMVFEGYSSMLVIKKESLNKLIDDNKLAILWAMYTEKQGGKYHFQTRKVVTFKNGCIERNIFDEESWKSPLI